MPGKLTRAGNGGRCQPHGKIGGKTKLLAGGSHNLDHQEDVCRATARNGGDRIKHAFFRDLQRFADSGQQIAREVHLRLACRLVADIGGNPASDCGRCIRHGADDRGIGAKQAFEIMDGLAGGDGEKGSFRPGIAGKRCRCVHHLWLERQHDHARMEILRNVRNIPDNRHTVDAFELGRRGL